MMPSRSRERFLYRLWQHAVQARDAAGPYHPDRVALVATAKRREREWGRQWDVNARAERNTP
jgi:hypothetical protein